MPKERVAKSAQIAVRLEEDVIAKLDALAARLSTTWHQANRSDMVRAAIVEGIPVLERMAAAQASPVAPSEKPRRGGR